MRKVENGKTYLTGAERTLSTDMLWDHLKSLGYKIHRGTAARAKKSGWFVDRQNGAWGRKSAHGYVVLDDWEREQAVGQLSKKLNIDRATAVKAQERGWFEVTKTNKTT